MRCYECHYHISVWCESAFSETFTGCLGLAQPGVCDVVDNCAMCADLMEAWVFLNA